MRELGIRGDRKLGRAAEDRRLAIGVDHRLAVHLDQRLGHQVGERRMQIVAHQQRRRRGDER